jgi:isoquinoline 1-oxidoreductase subunit beta
MADTPVGCQTLRISRRAFLVRSGVTYCGVAFALAGCARQNSNRSAPGQTEPSALVTGPWVTLYSDGGIEIVTPGIELGQGAMSTVPRFLAEELDADWSHVRVIPAPSNEKTYGNPLFWGMQITAGSRTCLGYFDTLRVAGAQARYVLLTAATKKWQVTLNELTTQNSIVMHQPSGRRVTYGELVATSIVPQKFPEFAAPGDKPQLVDDFFGEAPPSELIQNAKNPAAIKLKSPKEYRLLGVDAPRLDIPIKVNGTARYGLDVQLPGMLYAMVETGPIQGVAPDQIDDSATRAVPGVVDVIRLPYGVGVMGANIFAAKKGREQLKVTWHSTAERTAYDSKTTIDDFARIAADPGHYAGVRVYERGDPVAAEKALSSRNGARANRIVSFEARSELVYHAPIEPQNATMRVAKDGKSAEAWVGTQWPALDQTLVSKVLDVPPESVKINTQFTGGSFGRRQEAGALLDAAHIARHTDRPVKVIWTREDDLKRNPFRQALVCVAEAAVTTEGRIVATRHRVVADSWFARMFPDYFEQYHKSDPGSWVGALHLYDVPLQIVDNFTARRSLDVCYMRGIGVTQTKFAQESLIDRIAIEHHKDPVEFRLQLLQASPRALMVLQTAAQLADWKRKRKGRALGVAYTPYSNSHAALIAEVSVDRSKGDIRVHEVWCAVDAGFAVQPAILSSQIEGGILQGLSMALFEKVTLKAGVVQESNFHDYPILRMSQTPDVTVQVLSTDNAITGAGEIGVMQIAPAINNALAQLIGKHLTTMPMLPADVMKALHK